VHLTFLMIFRLLIKKKKISTISKTYLDLKFRVLSELGSALRSPSCLLVSLLDLYSKYSVIFPMQVMLNLCIYIYIYIMLIAADFSHFADFSRPIINQY
jgi:hypothetical protein